MPRRRRRNPQIRRKRAWRRIWDAARSPERKSKQAKRRANSLNREAEGMAREAERLAGNARPQDRDRIEALRGRLQSWQASFQSISWQDEGLQNADLAPAYAAYGRGMNALAAAGSRLESLAEAATQARVRDSEAQAQKAQSQLREAELRAQESERRARALEASRPDLSMLGPARARAERERSDPDVDIS